MPGVRRRRSRESGIMWVTLLLLLLLYNKRNRLWLISETRGIEK